MKEHGVIILHLVHTDLNQMWANMSVLLNADIMSALLLRDLKKITPLVIIIVILTLPVAM